jgi:hypothetical protein
LKAALDPQVVGISDVLFQVLKCVVYRDGSLAWWSGNARGPKIASHDSGLSTAE